MPPSVAAIPVDVLAQQTRARSQSVQLPTAAAAAAATAASSAPAAAVPQRDRCAAAGGRRAGLTIGGSAARAPTVWARLRARNNDKEREEHELSLRLQRELREQGKK
jgi:hypothetical protein